MEACKITGMNELQAVDMSNGNPFNSSYDMTRVETYNTLLSVYKSQTNTPDGQFNLYDAPNTPNISITPTLDIFTPEAGVTYHYSPTLDLYIAIRDGDGGYLIQSNGDEVKIMTQFDIERKQVYDNMIYQYEDTTLEIIEFTADGSLLVPSQLNIIDINNEIDDIFISYALAAIDNTIYLVLNTMGTQELQISSSIVTFDKIDKSQLTITGSFNHHILGFIPDRAAKKMYARVCKFVEIRVGKDVSYGIGERITALSLNNYNMDDTELDHNGSGESLYIGISEIGVPYQMNITGLLGVGVDYTNIHFVNNNIILDGNMPVMIHAIPMFAVVENSIPLPSIDTVNDARIHSINNTHYTSIELSIPLIKIEDAIFSDQLFIYKHKDMINIVMLDGGQTIQFNDNGALPTNYVMSIANNLLAIRIGSVYDFFFINTTKYTVTRVSDTIVELSKNILSIGNADTSSIDIFDLSKNIIANIKMSEHDLTLSDIDNVNKVDNTTHDIISVDTISECCSFNSLVTHSVRLSNGDIYFTTDDGLLHRQGSDGIVIMSTTLLPADPSDIHKVYSMQVCLLESDPYGGGIIVIAESTGGYRAFIHGFGTYEGKNGIVSALYFNNSTTPNGEDIVYEYVPETKVRETLA